jgi:pheromone a factor receptor
MFLKQLPNSQAFELETPFLPCLCPRMRDPVFPAFCALAVTLCLLPLPWHWKARNTATLMFLGWTITGCAIYGINSLVWAGNLDDLSPLWCDICERVQVRCRGDPVLIWIVAVNLFNGLGVGGGASFLCISRRIYRIATTKRALHSYSQVSLV